MRIRSWFVAALVLCGSAEVARAQDAPGIGAVAIGESISELRTRLGDPIRFDRIASGNGISRYPVDRGALLVDEADDIVKRVRLMSGPTPISSGGVLTDGYGVKLGMPRNRAIARHTRSPFFASPSAVEWREKLEITRYGFDTHGTTVRIDVQGRQNRASTHSQPVATRREHDGSSVARAIVISVDERYLADWIRFYFASNSCDGIVPWTIVREPSTFSSANRHDPHLYRSARVFCPSSQRTKNFYFDVSVSRDSYEEAREQARRAFATRETGLPRLNFPILFGIEICALGAFGFALVRRFGRIEPYLRALAALAVFPLTVWAASFARQIAFELHTDGTVSTQMDTCTLALEPFLTTALACVLVISACCWAAFGSSAPRPTPPRSISAIFSRNQMLAIATFGVCGIVWGFSSWQDWRIMQPCL